MLIYTMNSSCDMPFKNRTKQLLKDGKQTVGLFLGLPSYDIAEVFSKAEIDWLLFDMEHGSIHFDMLPWLMAAASGGDATPLVRVPWNDPVYVKLALDRGAQGIMFPQVNTREAAVKAVKSCRYPPEGTRGIGPRRASDYYTKFSEYLKVANRETMVIIQIESKEAVDNIDEIASVKGVDVLFLGPDDLSASMGYISSLPKKEKPVLDSMAKVLKAAERYKIPVGVWGGDVETTNQRLKEGYQMVSLGEDAAYITKVYEDLQKIKRP